MKNKYKVTVEVTEQMLHDNVVAAFESSWGVHHWANVSYGKHKSDYSHYFTATITDHYEGEVYQLSIGKLVNGLRILAEKYPHHFGDILMERGDAVTGDVLVQCAVLGDIVYG